MKKLVDQFSKLPLPAQIAIVGGAAFGVYKLVKFITRPKPTTYVLPAGGAGIPVTGYNQQGQPIQWNPEPLVDELYDVMDGLFTFSDKKDQVFKKLATLPTNDMVVATYNRFNIKHGAGDTLTQWIDDEYWYDYLDTGKSDALNRLRGLGLN